MSVPSQVISIQRTRGDSRLLINEEASKELIFAVVGPAGSGTTFIAEKLVSLAGTILKAESVSYIKASVVIADSIEKSKLDGLKKLDRAQMLQDAGDELRKSDEAAIGTLLAMQIKQEREKFKASKDTTNVSALHQNGSDEPPRVYVIDSLKHPAEVELLRAVYREAFCLVGVVCEEETRRKRLRDFKCKSSSGDEINDFMKRDEDGDEKWGQKVSKTFHLSDFFVDNTPDQFDENHIENPAWVIPDKLARLLDILDGKKVLRPLPSETGMFHAVGAKMRSACLSRQVGAALTDAKGNVIATGTNEVPRAGGGVYGGDFEFEGEEVPTDHRCAVQNKYCSNTRIQGEIMEEVIKALPQKDGSLTVEQLKKALKGTTLARLLEYSRAVHAEMDALLTAARLGKSTIGTKLFVTTFPCHYCARHIVSAGVTEVQYIEPYPKSRAFSLHGDAIEPIFTKWVKGSKAGPAKVLFRPFTGVAPRLYARVFMKNRELKNGAGDLEISEPLWAPGLLQTSYLQLEKKLEGSE